MDVKGYLRLYEDSLRHSLLIQEERKEELAMIKGLRSKINGTDDLKLQQSLDKLTITALKIKEDPTAVRLREEILTIIEDVPGIKGEILHLRYIDFMKWENIEHKIYLSGRRIRGIHKEALEELRSVLISKGIDID